MYIGIRFEVGDRGIFFDYKIFKELVKQAKKVGRGDEDCPTFLEYYCSYAPCPYEQYKGYENFEGKKFAFADVASMYEMFNLDNPVYFRQLQYLLEEGKITAKHYTSVGGMWSKDYKETMFYRQSEMLLVSTSNSLDEVFNW